MSRASLIEPLWVVFHQLQLLSDVDVGDGEIEEPITSPLSRHSFPIIQPPPLKENTHGQRPLALEKRAPAIHLNLRFKS